MAIKIMMPALSPTMKRGKLAKWNVKEGDKIRISDIIAEIETDKAVMEFESVDEGIIGPILLPEGSEVDVGEQIGWILEGADDVIPDINSPVQPAEHAQMQVTHNEQPVALNKQTLPELPEPPSGKNAFSTPAARARAKELGVTIEEMRQTGITKKIKERDVVEFSSQQTLVKSQPNLPNKANQTTQPQIAQLSGMQKTIAKRMVEAKSTVPHFYLEVLACIDKLTELQKICKDKNLKATLTHLFIKCIAHAMEEVPQMNVSWHEGQIQHHGSIGIAVAVSTGDDGLITPIIQNTNHLGIREIIESMNDLVTRAKDARLAAHEFQGGSITISSLGMYGIHSVYPIMNLPQASIIGIGAARDELYLENELVKSRKVCSLTISVDHRVINGAVAARFMQTLKSIIEQPIQILI